MPKVTFVKSARKANPVADVGESYYWWAFRYGGKRFSKTPPPRSALTQSEHLSALWSLTEDIENAEVDNGEDLELLKADAVSRLEDLRDAAEDSLGNMPEGLQESPTGELLRERADALEAAISEVESVDSEEAEDLDDEGREIFWGEALDALLSAVEGADVG